MTTATEPILSLDRIKEPIDAELKAFDKFFRDAMRSKVGLVDLVARYVVRQKGKRVRPILVLLSAKASGGLTEATFRGATLVEILHTATLVHDDVVDEADTRRGLASINAIWKNKVAVLMGDFLLARGLLLALEHKDYGFLHSTSRAVQRMSEGELLQIQKTRQLNNDEETYLKIIADKTASLFSTCTEIGALSAQAGPVVQVAMRAYGESVGMAFQIRDDLLDYVGRRGVLGKPVGLDMKEKKLTLPLIVALRNAPRTDGSRALNLIRNGASRKERTWLVDFAERNGGIRYALEKGSAYAAEAQGHLEAVPPSEARDALQAFVDFVLRRDR